MTQTNSMVTAPPEELLRAVRQSPVASGPGLLRGGSHIVGAFSIETFCNAGGLFYTHEDAKGFLDWLRSYGISPNFWFTDAGVKIWAYTETFDNWQDTYGFDADRISYHSGHGGMDANGTFYAPLGAAWAGNDCTVTSKDMAVGNEYLRYMFWSTCLSLRVRDGHTPIKTWHQANKGLRMIFGFETVSWDSPYYGSNFGKHWNAGESLSMAWLNASWDIAHDQAPSVAACGSTPEEAGDRLRNERYFSAEPAGNAWYSWWYYEPRAAVRDLNVQVPDVPVVARLASPATRTAAGLAERFGFDAGRLLRHHDGVMAEEGGRRLSVDDSGGFVVQLRTPNWGNRQPLPASDAQVVAAETVQRYGLDADGPVILDRIAAINEATAAAEGGDVRGPYQTGLLVQYRQVINGLPVVTPGAGTIRVFVDNDGAVTSVASSTRPVVELTDKPFGGPVREPQPAGSEASGDGAPDLERLLSRGFSDLLRGLALQGDVPRGFGVVPGTTEVGYDFQGDRAILVAQRAVELDFGGGVKKRSWVRTPVFG